MATVTFLNVMIITVRVKNTDIQLITKNNQTIRPISPHSRPPYYGTYAKDVFIEPVGDLNVVTYNHHAHRCESIPSPLEPLPTD